MSAVVGARPVRRRRLSTTAIVYLVLVAVVALSAVLVTAAGKSFFTAGNLAAILTLMSILGFVAIGQTLVILAGSLDLSVPYVVSTASIVGAGIMAQGTAGILPGVLACMDRFVVKKAKRTRSHGREIDVREVTVGALKDRLVSVAVAAALPSREDGNGNGS